MKYSLMIFIFVCSVFAQENKAQDVDKHEYNPYNSSISPQGSTDNYNPFHRWSNLSVPRKTIYWKADVDDIIGKWEYIYPPTFTIEFFSDSLGKTFQICDREADYETNGRWSNSYSDDMLMIVLKYFDIDAVEKLAVKRISKRKLAIGTNVNGEFVPQVHVKKDL